ncbi:beta strand repeat-containing protein, partial [Clostridium botulinum]
VKFSATVDAAPASGSKYVNSATVDYEFLSPDSTTLNASVTATNTLYSNSVVITPTIAKTAVSSNTIQDVAAVGDTIEYTITIENTSATDTIKSATLNDTLPSGLTYKTGTLTVNTITSTDPLTAVTLGDINPNSTTTVKFTADVANAPATGSKYVNPATVNYSFLSPDGTTLNNSVSANNTVYSNDIIITPTVSKTATSDNAVQGVVSVGNTIEYTITIENTSATATIKNATLNDVLPTELTYKTGTLTVNNSASTDPLTAVTLGDINPSATTTVKFSATVDAAPTTGSKYVNSATISYQFLSPDNTNISNNVSTTNTLYSSNVAIIPTIAKTAASSNAVQGVAAVGDTIDYTITIQNTSATATIQNATLNDVLPSELTYKTGTLTVNNSASTDPLSSVTLGNINPSATTTVRFTANVTAASTSGSKYINSATVNYEFLSPDGTTLSNSVSTTNTVYSSNVVITPNITKTATSNNPIQGIVTVGNTIEYTITIENTSAAATIQNATLNDALPTGLTYKTGTLLVNSNPSTDPLTAVTLGDINPSATTTVKFSADVTVAPTSGSKYVNSATVSYQFLSPDNTNLTASANASNTLYSDSIVITPTVSKTATSNNSIEDVVDIGNTVTYTILIKNTSNSSPLTSVSLKDTLPAELSYNANSLTINNIPNSDSPITGVTIGTINPSEITTIKFTANVNAAPASGSKYVNSATASYSFLSPDNTTISNSITASNTIYPSTVVITPTIAKAAVSSNAIQDIAAVGDTIDYTITIKNTSASATIKNATLNDALPTGLTYKAGTLSVNSASSNDPLTAITLGDISPS